MQTVHHFTCKNCYCNNWQGWNWLTATYAVIKKYLDNLSVTQSLQIYVSHLLTALL